jgi:hypothetical protein
MTALSRRLAANVIIAGCFSLYFLPGLVNAKVRYRTIWDDDGDWRRTPVSDWCERLVCSKFGSRKINMVVTGTKR